MRRVTIDMSVLELLGLHGNLALALRHPENVGASRPLMLHLLARWTSILLREGALSHEELEKIMRDEAAHGIGDVVGVYEGFLE